MTDMEQVPPGAVMVHEPHGFVKLNVAMADDLMVVNAARVSYAKQSEWGVHVGEEVEHFLQAPDAGLVRYLLKNKHGTPFEHTFFQFHIRAPIFVMREWHRHRIGISINEESARYVPLRPDFYMPDDAHVRIQVGKPGHYTYESVRDPLEAERVRGLMHASYMISYRSYERLMELGTAKEIARAVLPVGIYSQMMWTCNARSLMAFLSLRNSPQALHEIRDYAEAMEDIFHEVMPVTAAAFVDNGRIAP